MNQEEAKVRFGQRIQRCSGCYSAFYLRNMWLGPDATFYCVDCRDETMFHFDDYIQRIDLARFPSLLDEESTQCQNPFTRQA